MKALARFVGPVPSHDQSIELHNLLLETEQLSAERGETCAGNLRHPPVAWVGNNMQKFRNPFAPDRRDNAKLGKVRADRIDHCSLLADEQLARAVEHQTALLLGRLGGYEPHIGPGDRLANGLGISGVILLPFDVGLYVGRWPQSHDVAKWLELTRPMVR